LGLGRTCFGSNFSQGSHEKHAQRYAIIRRLEQKTGRPIGVLAAGPGEIIAIAGTVAAFYLNTLATLVLVSVLLWWRRLVPTDDLPRERLGSAIVTGLRYVAETRALRAVLTRGAVFGFAASASLALIARDRLGVDRSSRLGWQQGARIPANTFRDRGGHRGRPISGAARAASARPRVSRRRARHAGRASGG
jgi:ABC-type sugar transport system ATPase subunit